MIPTILKSLENADYKWNNLSTYAVFVPGLSYKLKTIEFQRFNHIIYELQAPDWQKERAKTVRVINISRWFLLGSLGQISLAYLALALYPSIIFRLFGLIAVADLFYTLFKCFTINITLHLSERSFEMSVLMSYLINPFIH